MNSEQAHSLYRHRTEIHIRYGDIDMLHHVNNAKYQTYLEEARIRYCMDVLNWDGDWRRLNMILAKVQVEFRKPLYLNDSLVIHTRVKHIGNKSFTMDYIFVRNNGTEDEIVAEAETVMVAYDPQTGHSIPVADDIRAKMKAFEPTLQYPQGHSSSL